MKAFPTADSQAAAQTGLSPREIYLFVSSLNGIRPMKLGFIGDLPSYLSMLIAGETASAFEDLEEIGFNLGTPRDDSADVPYQFSDLSEKVQQLTTTQASYLLGFAAGFWEARSLERG